MAIVDPVFEALRKDNTDKGGVEGLWRVQKLELVAVPKGQFGQFYEGDCYLLYDNKEGVEHVHFWIGNECSIDEQAVAAIKAVELDNLFGGLPIQHRETQGHESAQFKKYFEPGMVIKKGGMESGLQKAETNAHDPKLFKVAGGMRPVLTEVDISWSSMNHGDVFVLDSGKRIFVWAGANSSGGERMTAGMVAAKMRDHPGEDICHIDDGDEEGNVDEEWTEHLPLDGKGAVLDKDVASDNKVNADVERKIELHKISDASGTMSTELVKTGDLEKDDLNGDDAFLVSGGQLGIWIWLGKKATMDERKAAMKLGEKFIKDNNMSKHTALTRTFQTGEAEEFKTLFTSW